MIFRHQAPPPIQPQFDYLVPAELLQYVGRYFQWVSFNDNNITQNLDF